MKRVVACILGGMTLAGCASSGVQSVALSNDPPPNTCSKVTLRDFSSTAVAMICYDSDGRPIGQTSGEALSLADAGTALARSAILATGIGVGASLINTSPTIEP